ncbi:hypothetical protein A4U61_28935 [Streptomyces sp. H-KF8]|uniref:DUF5819 family protein n=1 Tax=Streptomyces sp. H-KF8 TaxID=1727216 RepID=UPI0007EC6A59|nr:DUF5819 family protein [Streptomyces sp. H-KF8]OBQ50009.1 hypothetical protein A4U61_28935 [Streptomyces sp. H-KF8]
MDAYDEGSHARHGRTGPGGPGDPASPSAPPASVPAPVGQDGPRPSADTPPGSDAPPPSDVPSASDTPPAPGAPSVPDADPPPPTPPPEPRTGVAALSLPYRIAAAVALGTVAVVVCAHLGMTFLHVAPANTVSKKHAETIEDWIYPEFEQNWKLFAPNPLQQNISVQVRAEVLTPDGGVRTTGWYDLSAEDGRAIDGNLLPSHTQQNELRRAWDFFVATHDGEDRPVGMRGTLAESYLRRIMVMRLGRSDAAGPGGVVDQIQVRSRTTEVPPPEWSEEKVSTKPVYRTLPWWPVPQDEARGGIG